MEIDITNLKSAYLTLKTSIQKLEENKHCDFADMLEDSCIKRFDLCKDIILFRIGKTGACIMKSKTILLMNTALKNPENC